MSDKSEDLSTPIYLFHEGSNARAYEFLGSHFNDDGSVTFRVWAPRASAVSVCGDFNSWDEHADPMNKINEQGLWEVRIDGPEKYDKYKYQVTSPDGRKIMKSDPYGFHFETRPGNATKIYDISGFKWTDEKWQQKKEKTNIFSSPVNIYEIHAGSWKLHDDGNFYSYRDLADELIPYIKEMGYTHVEVRHARGFRVFH